MRAQVPGGTLLHRTERQCATERRYRARSADDFTIAVELSAETSRRRVPDQVQVALDCFSADGAEVRVLAPARGSRRENEGAALRIGALRSPLRIAEILGRPLDYGSPSDFQKFRRNHYDAIPATACSYCHLRHDDDILIASPAKGRGAGESNYRFDGGEPLFRGRG